LAVLTNLANQLRFELGDLGKSFVTNFVADGTTNRFRLHYAPLDGDGVKVFKNGVDISTLASVEEQTGVLVTDTVPADGDELLVSGTYYRYFTATEIKKIVEEALITHTNGHTDVVGRQLTLENLPTIEEYPVVIHAVTLALYTLATDAAFDIDIQAPDGVNIPRSERYRQLMDMVQARQSQYRELCTLLGVGLYKIDVFNLNRISKATGRLVPMYVPQEVDDRSYPERTHVTTPTLGSIAQPWETESGELTAYQGRAFSHSLSVIGNYAGKSFIANLLNQRGSVLTVQPFTLDVTTSVDVTITAVSRTASSTSILLTTSTPHSLVQGELATIIGVDSTVNGTVTVASIVSTTQFTVTGTATTALALTNLSGQVSTTGTDVITAATRTAGSTSILLTTNAVNSLAQGDAVVITDVDSTVDGFGTVATIVSNTQFTITGIATTALALTGLAGQAETDASKAYTFDISLIAEQTLRLAERTYWSISTVDAFTNEKIEIQGGKFYTVRRNTVVL